MNLPYQKFASYLDETISTGTLYRGKLRWLIRFAQTLALLSFAACLGLAYLIYPGTPSRSDAMRFEGFVTLPGAGTLNVLDYLAWREHAVFVAGTSSGSVFEVGNQAWRLGANKSLRELRGAPGVHGIAFARDPNIAFVTRSGANVVDAVDVEKRRILTSIPVADDPDAILYDQNHHLIYVVNGDAHLATLIDPDRRVTVAAIPLRAKPEYAVIDPLTGLLYQNLADINSIAAVDLQQRAIVEQWKLTSCEGPSGLAIDSEHRRLFAACSGNSSFVVFDLERHTVIGRFDTGRRPDSVAFDPSLRRIYVASLGGKLTVVQQDSPDAYHLLDQISTHYGAHTLLIDPASHCVYVAYSTLLTAPRLAAFTPLHQGDF